MNKLAFVLVFVTAGTTLAPAARSDGATTTDVPALMKQKRCVLCHDQTQRRVGPPYNMIATFYAKNDRDQTLQKLTRKILKGGGGTWGPIPMPASENVSEDEAEVMANWILDLNTNKGTSPPPGPPAAAH
ncbi:MAG: cytochrome C [Gammaproteobacteria bacterium]